MQIRKALELLRLVQEGHDTVGELIIYTKNHSIGYMLNQALEFGFVEKFEEGRRRPYKLTEKGIKFLELMADC
jgi:predicted transcriptional regulator